MPLLAVGDVVRLFDGTIATPKPKRFLCVCVAQGWFFRINSRPAWRPHLAVQRRGNEACLDHDSFLELRGIIEYVESEVAESLRYPGNHLGRLCDDTLREICRAVAEAKPLTALEKRVIIGNLESVL